ncbi:MAG: polyphosphate kinase 1 [Bacteroidia bacterium]
MPDTSNRPNLSKPDYYINRELSWLAFNARVLNEAQNPHHPPLARLRFVAIFSNNLDEFFMIRVAGLKQQLLSHISEKTPDGLTPRHQLQAISDTVRALLEKQNEILYKDLLPTLMQHRIRIVPYTELSRKQRTEADAYFDSFIFPLLTPIALDSAHPLPQLRPLELIVWLDLSDGTQAILPIPNNLPRFYQLAHRSDYLFVPVEAIIEAHLRTLLPGKEVASAHIFRLTRNADLEISEAEADDLLELIEKEVQRRRLGNVVRLEVAQNFSPTNLNFLQEEWELQPTDIYPVEGLMGLERLWEIVEKIDEPDLLDPPFTPRYPQLLRKTSIFEAIAKQDILLHHPYDSFTPVIEFVQAAAQDPNVLAIKQMLYRTTGEKSQIVQALMEACQRGKQVTALIELKARFDEENNIHWARRLENIGANVIYGILGLKTHGKATLVVRKEAHHLKLYAHLSTGNYNEKTATIYTDLGLFTAHPAITRDVAELFNFLTGKSRQQTWRQIAIAPVNLRAFFCQEINQCIQQHTPSNPSHITLIMNSLVDPEMIQKLYEASMHGIPIQGVIRGTCCLKPALEGISETISIRSIVGRFLEHIRIYIFQSGGQTRIYSGSADWMPRNLDRRVEMVYPILDPSLQKRILWIAQTLLSDTQQAWILQPDGTYIPCKKTTNDPYFSAQDHFLHTPYAPPK